MRYPNVYNRADIYDMDTENFISDIFFYEKILKKYIKGEIKRVLEMACGTGRVTIPLGKSSNFVVGVDTSSAMLERARNKSTLKNIQFVQEDIRNFNDDSKYDLILVPFNSFQQLLTREDQLKCLENIKSLLSPSGYFIADIAVPTLHKGSNLYQSSKVSSDGRFLLKRTMESKVSTSTQIVTRKFYYDVYDNLTNHNLITSFWEERNYCNIYPLQWRGLLEQVGFKYSEYGNYDLSPFTDTSNKMLFLCTLA